ncbi:MAG TPA: hypothetical protein VF223_13045 [Trebonia sp.]
MQLVSGATPRTEDVQRAVLLILDYLERLRREAERSDDNNAVNTGEKVARSGDTMTGPLTLSGDATDPLHPVTKQQYETPASDTVPGLVELATKAEVETGTDTGRVPSVATLQHHKGVAKAWVRFNPSGTILESHGVSSVTDIGTGNWQVHWATPFATSTYAVQGTSGGSSTAPGLRSINIGQSATTSTHVACRNDSNGLADPEHSVMVTAWGTV